ncbi:nucleoside triphosphate pyrophosphohydrolase [Nonomuraea endophytica]|uniref:Putative house-cleaning noncanonical NTP pyrophosphatase (MazG superfamily) n=1 Tax=Nonomuraea endophytica TaxID=714136 RepID=A0A7W8ABQ5_9ACTN|nr:nucleoside triphosphate pyrophosphohydrolase [Nonomuraea endophytica]MBB5083326.1 putative house-cleaning noncanonical NTP pyrophosphatase (MazG superfamily) [Nonomuraea endophytica]
MGKLVRDNIPEIIRQNGGEPVVRVLDLAEYRQALVEKLFEEAAELRDASADEVAEEIADVYEVLRAIATADGHDWAVIEKAAAAKLEERGAFRDRLYLA